jgi:hypothetical protein
VRLQRRNELVDFGGGAARRVRIFGGGERDTVFVRDGWRDTIDCGTGADTVDAD